LFVACSCTGEPPTSEASKASVPPGAVAVVGDVPITEDRVLAVARAQGIDTPAAAESEIRDALFASAAQARGYDSAFGVRAAVRGRLSRVVLRELYRDAGASEPTIEELAAATERHFLEFDRPEAFRVIHAVVRVDEAAPATRRAGARALAERIAERVARAATGEEFRREVDAVGDHGDLEVSVEALKPVAADGRVIDAEHEHDNSPPERYDLAFARAASLLTSPGAKTPVVATPFGFHVLMLLERLPAHVVPIEERRVALHDEIVSERAKAKRAELTKQLRAASAAIIERSADALIATIHPGMGDDETR
jgi:peptidyl-prolyl cis-trans isomerase C